LEIPALDIWRRLEVAIRAARSDEFGGKVLLSIEDAETLLAFASKNGDDNQQPHAAQSPLKEDSNG